MKTSPQRQTILSLVPRLAPFESDGNRICCIQETGPLTYLGISGQGGTWPNVHPDGDVEHTGCITASLGGRDVNVVVFGFCLPGTKPVPPPSGEFDGAVLLRDARRSELTEEQLQTGTSAETIIGLEQVSDDGSKIVMKAATDPVAYLLIV